MAGKTGRRAWGRIRKLPSGNYQAGYVGPDTREHKAPVTFTTKLAAEGWLADERRLIERGDWTPPGQRTARARAAGITVGEYVDRWLRESESRLRPTTLAAYRASAEQIIVPALGEIPLTGLTADRVRSWWSGLDPSHPTRRAHAYSLLRAIMNTAVEDGLIATTPCRVRGGASRSRQREPVALTPAQVLAVAEAVPTERWAALVVVLGLGGLRWGEAIALRRSDIDLDGPVPLVRVRRAAARLTGRFVEGPPKSAAGRRDVPLPEAARSWLRRHLEAYAEAGEDGLVFPAPQGGHAHRGPFLKALGRATEAAGVPRLAPHDLRHSAITSWARAGAVPADMLRLAGHTTVAVSMIYQHSDAERAAEVARRMLPEE